MEEDLRTLFRQLSITKWTTFLKIISKVRSNFATIRLREKSLNNGMVIIRKYSITDEESCSHSLCKSSSTMGNNASKSSIDKWTDFGQADGSSCLINNQYSPDEAAVIASVTMKNDVRLVLSNSTRHTPGHCRWYTSRNGLWRSSKKGYYIRKIKVAIKDTRCLQPTSLSTNTSNWSICQNISIREIDHRALEHQFNWNQDSAGKAVCHKWLSSIFLPLGNYHNS